MKNFNLVDLNSNLDVLNFLPDWVKITSVNGVVIFANKPLVNKLNFDPQGMKIDDLKTTKFKDIFSIYITPSDFKDEDMKKSDLKFDGKVYDVSTAPIRDDFGAITAYVDIYRDMTSLKNIQNQLTIKNEIMNKDLTLTKKIQESILPVDLDFGRLKVDYMYQPCEQLSGDIFDVISINKNITSAYICDVSGHGVPAAMVTVFVRETMRNLQDYHSSAYDLTELHRRFLDLRLDISQYLTMFHVLIDTNEQTISYSNAGHNCPMLLIRGNDVIRIEMSGKPVCSYFENIDFKEKVIRFNPGDKILLFTDGIKETQNKDGEEYGIDRVESIIRRKPNDILKTLRVSLDYFNSGVRYDDMCAVLIEFKDKGDI